jgi:hypothetical protein
MFCLAVALVLGYFTNHGMKADSICSLLDGGASDNVVAMITGNKVGSLAPYHQRSHKIADQAARHFRSEDAPPLAESSSSSCHGQQLGSNQNIGHASVLAATSAPLAHSASLSSSIPMAPASSSNTRGVHNNVRFSVDHSVRSNSVSHAPNIAHRQPRAPSRFVELASNPFADDDADDEFGGAFGDFDLDDPSLIAATSSNSKFHYLPCHMFMSHEVLSHLTFPILVVCCKF